ncbi:MAG: hypothetical protein HC851_08740 [Acaryochloris sp. RU_4_1]|nr:hypothetical protein [Acaryochloris sp. RU_4_1]
MTGMIKTIRFRQGCCSFKATARAWRWGWIALLTTCLVVLGHSGIAPVAAQSPETAMIQVDGIPLFPVSASEELPAKQRAENVNQMLQGLVNSPAAATVTIDNSQALPVLKVDVDNRQADLDLLIVNSKDAGSPPDVRIGVIQLSRIPHVQVNLS